MGREIAGGRAVAPVLGRDRERIGGGSPGIGKGCPAAGTGDDGDVAARLRSQSRALLRLASTRVFARGDDALLLEASAWLEVLGNSLEGGGGVPAGAPVRQRSARTHDDRRVQQGQGPALRRRE